MELRLSPDQVVAIVEKYLDEELQMGHFQIDQLRGVVPRKVNSGLSIELELSIPARKRVGQVSEAVQQSIDVAVCEDLNGTVEDVVEDLPDPIVSEEDISEEVEVYEEEEDAVAAHTSIFDDPMPVAVATPKPVSEDDFEL